MIRHLNKCVALCSRLVLNKVSISSRSLISWHGEDRGLLDRSRRCLHLPVIISRNFRGVLNTHQPTNIETMKHQYIRYQEKLNNYREGSIPPVEPKSLFANNEIKLSDIQVYGFDYDYTLVEYTPALEEFIYCQARDLLVNKYKYPTNLQHLEFNPLFAIRGLHYDILKGLIMKVDAFHNIQLGTVYRGLSPVPDEKVMELYKGIHIGKQYLTNRGTNEANQSQTMTQLIDSFAKPEMNLLANVVEYFVNHNIEFDPEYLFYDVSMAVRSLHKSGELHSEIMNNLEKYVKQDPEIRQMLERLRQHGKKVFMISNSDVEFINRGMSFVVGPDWTDLFDVIVVAARKPSFFTEDFKPFRRVDLKSDVRLWEKVSKFETGIIYREGNLRDFQKFTNWPARTVLYFGDHVFSDLADVSINHGWRTGAIIPELQQEIEIANSQKFRDTVGALQELEKIIDQNQHVRCMEGRDLLHKWRMEREDLRYTAKKIFNPQFGSIFRTFHNQSYFTQRLARYADLYTASVTTLLRYPSSHTFYPRRSPLPHEVFFS